MPAKKGPKKEKSSRKDVDRVIEQVEAEIEKERKKREKKEKTFTALSREDLKRKLKRTHSPIIVWQGWNNTAPHGGTINYSVGVHNPDPFGWNYLALSVAVGNRNAIADPDLFLSDFDARFPTLAQPATLGFSLAAGASTSYNFKLKIPAGVAKTGYFGNSSLLHLDWHDVGTYLDRGVFFFEVV